MRYPISSLAARHQLEKDIHYAVETSFTENRLVPNFHEKLLGATSEKFVEFFQTLQFWELTQQYSPTVLFDTAPDGTLVDKVCLRDAASALGLPPELVWRKKSPLQFSSGIVGALTAIARQQCRTWPGATTYTDPATESADVLLARYALHTLASDATGVATDSGAW